MKREYVEEKQDLSNSTSMFSNLHHHPHSSKFQHPSQPQPHHPTATECPPTSQEADSHCRSPNRRRNVIKEDPLAFPPPPPTNDGATIEVVRRPRGRPPGSKNKPKAPVIITGDSSEPTMSPYVLELPPGVDIIESTTRFCRKRNMGLCVLNGNGVVANVILKQPSTTPGATVTFHGRFDILSISATILPPGGLVAGNGLFTLYVAGPQGQVVGGLVVGPLVSAGTIYLIAASFNNPSFHRLQQVDHDQDAAARDGGHDSQKEASGGGDSAAPASGGISMYSYKPSDVIWTPTTRQPQPPPPPPPPPPPY
ncbi:hypothetical protein Pfo_021848 [Paulownia fortunei]|nr:hypothetical protein Pfo_021848 [Paulownia fortunei]